MKKIAIPLLGATLAAAFSLAGASAAQASSLTAGTSAALGTAPSCISRVVSNNDPTDLSNTTVKLTNNCGQTMKVKVIFHAGADSACHTLSAGQVKTIGAMSVFSTYDKTVTC
ncbi:hypothetical protein GCM10022252_07660 [Streptosporangium oxazolinicum]|uniref:Beta-Ig-H3/fasciclin n=1 Tax=Streptosporangium oxazolinicum TaxID=909287 RepID=A0ABP8ADP2_9ACTN